MNTTIKSILIIITAVISFGCSEKVEPATYKYAKGSTILNNQENLTIEILSDQTAVFSGESAKNTATVSASNKEITFTFKPYQQVGLNGTTLVFTKIDDDLLLKNSPQEVRFTRVR